ncbi:MAG: hypothetical protein VX438_13680, partial [Planctomycetota bacterium]|nr:hypothetical protein [Planctomycetota bacterium]
DLEKIEVFCKEQLGLGVTRILPTLTTNSLEVLGAALENLAHLADQSPLFDSMFLGVHLEGPYISPVDGPRGAHPKLHCRIPDIEEFQWLQARAQGRIRLVTLSPEFETSDEMIRSLVAEGVIASIGHTAASCEQIRRAVDSGATMSTHLGNGMHPEILRHPNYLWEQIADDRLMGGLIADGVHLDKAVLKVILRSKGNGNCVLVSDTTHLSGMPAGLYTDSSLGDVEVTEDQRLVIAGQRQLNAGAYRPLKYGVEFLMKRLQLPMRDAFRLASLNPLGLMNPKLPETELLKTFVVVGVNRQNSIEVVLSVIDNQVVFQAA